MFFLFNKSFYHMMQYDGAQLCIIDLNRIHSILFSVELLNYFIS